MILRDLSAMEGLFLCHYTPGPGRGATREKGKKRRKKVRLVSRIVNRATIIATLRYSFAL
jgi:hypothetical protein